MVTVPSGDPLLGQTLSGKYRVNEIIGKGSMGTVYLAEHIGLAKPVAIKVLRPDLEVSEETLQRFQREGIAAGRFDHPNAIQIFDFDQAGDVIYLAMEYVNGITLTDFLRDQGKMDLGAAIGLTKQILSALAAAHEKGIIHRDLKPDNIMLKRGAGGRQRIKLLDFGLSKLVHQPLGASLMTQPGRIMGTPRYMAPEQGSGEVADERTDLYAVGLVLYEMLAGDFPFQADTMRELFVKQATETPPSLLDTHPEVDEDLDEFLAIALEKAPEDRFQTAVEMLEALEDLHTPAARPARAKKKSKGKGKTRSAASAKAPRRRSKREAEDSESAGGRPAWLIPAIAGGVVAVVAIALIALKGDEQAVAPPEPPKRVRQIVGPSRTPEQAAYVASLDQARALIQQGKADEALQKLAGLDFSPLKDAEFCAVKGNARRLRNDDDLALADYREAQNLDPSYGQAFEGQGWIELERGDIESARQSFQSAEEASGEPTAGRGAIEYLEGNLGEAQDTLKEVLLGDPRAEGAQLYLGLVLRDQGEDEEAFQAFLEAVRASPQDWRPLVALGHQHQSRGEPDQAIKRYEDALARRPDTSEAIEALGTILLGQERYNDAEAALSQHAGSYSGTGAILLLRALIAQGRGDAAGAEKSLRRAQAAGVDLPELPLLLGQRAHRGGDLEEALGHYKDATALAPDSSLAHKNLGLALMGLERFDESRAALRRSLELNRDDPYAHYAMGVLCMEYLGEPDLALQAFQTYRNLGGSDPAVGSWISDLAR